MPHHFSCKKVEPSAHYNLCLGEKTEKCTWNALVISPTTSNSPHYVHFKIQFINTLENKSFELSSCSRKMSAMMLYWFGLRWSHKICNFDENSGCFIVVSEPCWGMQGIFRAVHRDMTKYKNGVTVFINRIVLCQVFTATCLKILLEDAL